MSVINAVPLLAAAGEEGYQISRSVRLRSSASAYFNRTPGSAGNRKTWTWSGWVKRGSIGSTQLLFQASNGSSSIYEFRFISDGGSSGVAESLQFSVPSGYAFRSTAVRRDPSAWGHVVLSVDTTQGTASNRAKIYYNGVLLPSDGSAVLSLNEDTSINNTLLHTIGNRGFNNTLHFDGYLTEINFIDGQALDASSFGETDTITGVWKPKRYAGTYGTNGFFLNFSDNTSTTTLGYDTSGNGNNWTANNISLTSGETYDSMTDVPTLTSEDAANYAVLNPLDTGSYLTIQNGNLRAYGNTASNSAVVRGTVGANQGKFYWETTITTVGGISYAGMGIEPSQNNAEQYWIASGYTKGCGRCNSGGSLYSGYGGYGAVSGITAASFTTNDVIGVAVDFDNGALYYSKNGTWENSGDPTSGASKTGAFNVWTAGAITGFPAAGGYNGSVNDLNCGQRPFAYTPPTGFKALNTFNLPDSNIVDGSQYFDVVTRAGNGGTYTKTGLSFQPDFAWIKCRSASSYHQLIDSIRGVSKVLNSNYTGGESSYPSYSLTAFNSDGYTLVDDASASYGVNGSTGSPTYVDWLWKANGAGVSNTDGSITSTVSANTTAGFSIVTGTTPASGSFTVGHGLGVAPAMYIVKRRSTTSSWGVWHQKLAGGTSYLLLESTVAQTTDSTVFSAAPSSTVLNLGSAWSSLGAQTFVAYCFSEVAGFSKFGSYTGNGSADGPFVFCGFRPAFVMIKRTDNVGYWWIYDTSRSTYNAAIQYLYADTSAAEVSDVTEPIDFLSNGFKLRMATYQPNTSGGTFIYMAFAENPFKNALAR